MRTKNIISGILCSFLLCPAVSLSAQTETLVETAVECESVQAAKLFPAVQVHPANASDGKILTMEETILSRELNPENRFYSYVNGGKSLASWANGTWSQESVAKGTSEEYQRRSRVETPSDAENLTESAGGLMAYTLGKSLYYADKEGTIHLVAESENPEISYGTTVSRNEFGIDGGIFWSPDGTKFAFYRKDESRVTTFPLLDINTRTGSLVEIKYPMAGMDSENVQVGIYDVAGGTVVYVKEEAFGYDRYLTNVCWSEDAQRLFIQVLDRSQKHLKLNMYDACTGECLKTLLTEDNERFVEPYEPLYRVKAAKKAAGPQYIYSIDNRDGYKNLYLLDEEGSVERLTKVDADVQYAGNDGVWVYYTSAEVSPVENHLFRVNLKNRKVQRLTTEPGWHNITLAPDCSSFVDSYSSLNVPRVINLRKSDGKLLRNLLTAGDPTIDYAYTRIDLGTVKSADGKYDNYYRMIYPKDFDPAKKYPVILYVYGGPHSQMVTNTYLANLRRWEMYMAQRGYLVYVQDNRGTSNRGAEFEKAIYGRCGQAEMADQMEGMKMLMSLPYVDRERIGVHGWSYGGFMTISLITNYPEVFKVAVAGGPVMDWKWYEVMYGERYMSNPHDNPEGYAETSLINRAKDLKGKLLICQGAIDNTVLWEHSLSFIRECIKNNVQVDYFPYPCAEHNVMGKDRVHLMDKVTMYFEDYL
ncbi:MAG: DPP IV N-terminal domain-containing protein [Candidatus Cryptobacteroides sp.]